MGNEKEKLLTSFPSKLSSFLPPEICEKVTKLWKVSTNNIVLSSFAFKSCMNHCVLHLFIMYRISSTFMTYLGVGVHLRKMSWISQAR